MIQIAHLETEITAACQLSCVSCNHLVPLWRKAGPRSTTTEGVERDLTHLATILHTEKWATMGGEPTLHHKLVDILKVVRGTGIADVLEVWTNGLTIRKQTSAFWKAFDHLIVSIYPGKLTEDDVDWIKNKCADEGVVYSPRDERKSPNFRTLLEPRPTDPAVTIDKFARCFFRQFSRNASYGYFFTCCCGPHIPLLIQGRSYGTDGVLIEGLTETALGAYLHRTEPLGACTVCAGRETAKPHPWGEERDPVKWAERSKGL